MIYTKTGDTGTTSLANGTRISKTDIRLEAYGTVDELNSHIGLLIHELQTIETAKLNVTETSRLFLQTVQADLFVLGSMLAGAEKMSMQNCKIQLADIEQEIDLLTSLIPPLHSFILPAGNHAACQGHICRTVCRRAERLTWIVIESIENCQHKAIAQYLNRLSDYFFVLSRFINTTTNTTEKCW